MLTQAKGKLLDLKPGGESSPNVYYKYCVDVDEMHFYVGMKLRCQLVADFEYFDDVEFDLDIVKQGSMDEEEYLGLLVENLASNKIKLYITKTFEISNKLTYKLHSYIEMHLININTVLIVHIGR